MNTFATTLCLFASMMAFAVTSNALDLHLTDGRIFTNVVVQSKDAKELKIMHQNGVAIISTESLSRADFLELGIAETYSWASPRLVAESSIRDFDFWKWMRDYPSNYAAHDSNSSLGLGGMGVTSSVSSSSGSASAVSGSSGSVGKISPGGPVHVSGYTRQNGTYVQPYTRRR